jgi:hypothetical protein
VLKDEPEGAIEPLFTLAAAIRIAYTKQHPTIDKNNIAVLFTTDSRDFLLGERVYTFIGPSLRR